MGRVDYQMGFAWEIAIFDGGVYFDIDKITSRFEVGFQSTSLFAIFEYPIDILIIRDSSSRIVLD